MRLATLQVGADRLLCGWNSTDCGWRPLHGDGITAELLSVLPDLSVPRTTTSTELIRADEASFLAPYRNPGKIVGIGLNYRRHAADLGATAPDEPVIFIKGAHTVIGHQEAIELPSASQSVTAEGELGLIIGRRCWEVPASGALRHVFGFCAVLDQTAEDILLRNPRFLTRAKNFPTFFSFGPEIVTLDELVAPYGRLNNVPIRTRKMNGTDAPTSLAA